MRIPLMRIGGRVAVLVLVALLAAACNAPGTGSSIDEETEPVDVDKGRQLFQTTCRSCHALADAKAAGVFGPDLDLLQPDAERVREQISDGGGGMPPQLLDGADADLVARYVAQVAGNDPAAGEPGPPTSRGSTRTKPGSSPQTDSKDGR